MTDTTVASRWIHRALLLLLTQRRPDKLRSGPVAVHLRVHVPSIASDGGNRLKLLEDVLVKANVIDDDRQLAVDDREGCGRGGTPRGGRVAAGRPGRAPRTGCAPCHR